MATLYVDPILRTAASPDRDQRKGFTMEQGATLPSTSILMTLRVCRGARCPACEEDSCKCITPDPLTVLSAWRTVLTPKCSTSATRHEIHEVGCCW